MPAQTLFRTVGTVFQDSWLFSGTIRDNVSMGQDDCSEQNIIECLRAAGANFIGDGTSADLDFLIQDQGSNLSGGQRQSVMMARALVFDPDILLFDEPTSAMDGLTESEVIASLSSSLGEKTLVVVTHKMPVVAMCDRVLVMDNGKLVGDGTKDAYFELLQKHYNRRLSRMDPSQNDGSGSRDYFMIFTVTLIFGIFLVWANYTHLDLVTRGGGRVIAAGQNKNVQSPERGTIATYMVEEGTVVSSGQIIATINPIEAAGVLEELEARLANLNIRLVRLDAELENKPVSVVQQLSSSYSRALVDAEVELMISRKASLDAELETLNQDRKKTIKAMMSLDAQISGRQVMQGLLVEEMKEVLPLVEAGALGSSEKFRLERQDASISTELEVLTEEKAQTKVDIEQIASKTDTVQQNYKTNIYQERSEVIGEISELEARLPAIRQRLKETDIRSPIDGIVNRVFFN